MEFSIESLPETQFRFKTISPVKLLSIQMIVDFDNFDKTTKLFSFILENTEVNIAGTWTNVKMKDRDVYMPQGIDKNLTALMQICTTFMNDVIKPVFQKSRE